MQKKRNKEWFIAMINMYLAGIEHGLFWFISYLYSLLVFYAIWDLKFSCLFGCWKQANENKPVIAQYIEYRELIIGKRMTSWSTTRAVSARATSMLMVNPIFFGETPQQVRIRSGIRMEWQSREMRPSAVHRSPGNSREVGPLCRWISRAFGDRMEKKNRLWKLIRSLT